jgi:Xaa-Pro aminopeptidase
MSRRTSVPDAPPASLAEAYAQRRARAVAALQQHALDALLVTNPRDIRYLCPFSGEDSVALLAPSGMTIISDFRFEEDLKAVQPEVGVAIRGNSMAVAVGAEVARVLGGRSATPRRLGFQAEHMSVQQRTEYAKHIRSAGKSSVKLEPTEGLLSELRQIKDAFEVKTIRRSVKLQEDALLATLPQLTPGQSETEVAGILEFEMRRRGADGPSFQTIAAARANGSKPHARPGSTRTAAARPLLIDWGARLDGYCSDLTRTFCFGRWPKVMREIYEITLEAQVAACQAVRPGMAGHELDAVARDIITQAGYGERFGHSLGHGIGLDVHELPRIARGSKVVLQPGMIVTIEPGIYLPGVGGVRIEDDVLVTERGGRILSRLPKDIDWATL